MEIDKQLYAEIKEYCELNGLKPREFVHGILKKAFMEEKFGKIPAVLQNNAKKEPKIIEVPKESRHEFEENVGKVIIQPQNSTESRQGSEKNVEKVNIQPQNEKNPDNGETKVNESTVESNTKHTDQKQTVKKRKL